YTQGVPNPYGQSGYVQPQAGQRPTDWAAPGSYEGVRPWDQGAGGVPMAPLQQAPKPRSRWTPAVLPLDGQDYASAYRPFTKRWGRWFAVGAIAAGFFMLGQMPMTVWMFGWMFSNAGDFMSGGPLDPMEAMGDLMGSPWFLLLTNFSWAIMIPGSILAMAVYGPKAWRFVLSVTGKWRWDVTLKSLGLIAPFFALYIGTMLFMEMGSDWQWNPNWMLVIIVLLTTPLQSAGEEFFFRGVLTQQIAGWIPRPVIGSLVAGGVTGIIFGAMHLHGFTLPTLQLMFVGFVCSLLTWRTGGLEAASVLHACNNVFIMLPLAFMGFAAFDPNAPGSDEAGASFGAELLVFGMATAAMALSYLAVHFGLRKEQRVTEGAPGAEALLVPSHGPAAPVGVAPGYGAPAQGSHVQNPYAQPAAPAPSAAAPPTEAPPTAPPPRSGYPPHGGRPAQSAPAQGMPNPYARPSAAAPPVGPAPSAPGPVASTPAPNPYAPPPAPEYAPPLGNANVQAAPSAADSAEQNPYAPPAPRSTEDDKNGSGTEV
ncbi:MAG TPA: CPBP family intramembrane metalloprotease, partial [Candidatus Agrococcus pullicola]|nr:CPBP family intramembrane metalloprotease [Candidatus Agrococcus pullicola]